ncbi:hypothetical protein [Paraflavitalea speifideaquila]|uniref:hypothetical protein n=1 Tax=Paraflavitalea speifideaquila TaxID=3076558 RepID=UPI0028EBB542|nr:hypothetical protein [Paraflavitalea speifideiaquila]
MNRKKFLSLTGVAGLAAAAVPNLVIAQSTAPEQKPRRYQKGVSPWPVCLDTATIRPASLDEKVRIAHKAGYDAIEPWDGELEKYEADGGNLRDLGKRLKTWACSYPV